MAKLVYIIPFSIVTWKWWILKFSSNLFSHFSHAKFVSKTRVGNPDILQSALMVANSTALQIRNRVQYILLQDILGWVLYAFQFAPSKECQNRNQNQNFFLQIQLDTTSFNTIYRHRPIHTDVIKPLKWIPNKSTQKYCYILHHHMTKESMEYRIFHA